MSTAKTEGKHTAEFVVAEAPGTISRDTVTVTVPADGLEAGAVLGIVSADGKHTTYDDANSDGTETAAAVLFDNLANDTEAPVDVDAVVVNFAAEVRGSDLVWKDGVDETKGKADLKALGIKVR